MGLRGEVYYLIIMKRGGTLLFNHDRGVYYFKIIRGIYYVVIILGGMRIMPQLYEKLRKMFMLKTSRCCIGKGLWICGVSGALKLSYLQEYDHCMGSSQNWGPVSVPLNSSGP